MQLFSQIIFPLFGIAMIILAIGAFFFKYGANIKENVQKLELFGVKLEISTITAIILGGMVFCGLGFYLNEKSYKNKYEKEAKSVVSKQDEIESLNTENKRLSDIINSYTTQSISYNFVLDNIDDNTAPPPANELTCIFYKNWRDREASSNYPVQTGINGYKVTFDNLSRQQLYEAAPVVYFVHKKTNHRWVANPFNPLNPTVSLLPED